MSKMILVYNDTLEIQSLFNDLLTEEGYTVIVRSYGTYDLDDVCEVHPALVIADCSPGGGEKEGWQFVQKLRMNRDTERIPVIICSTSVNMIRELEGLLTAQGIIAVPKPFRADELLHAVAQLIGRPDAKALGPLADATFDSPAPEAG